MLTTRGQFMASSALASSIMLPSCSAPSDAYSKAVSQTWRPFDNRLSARRLERELIRYATLAPSSHNTQCWRFRLARDEVVIEPDFSRRCPAVDPDDHHLFVSLGCATENLVQAARAHGLRGAVRFNPQGDGSVHVTLEPAQPQTSALFNAIPARQCTRAQYDGGSVEPVHLRMLEAAGRGTGVHVELLTARRPIEHVLEYVVDANTVQLNDSTFMAELRHWIRFNDTEAVAQRDGLFSGASGSPSLPRWLGTRMLKFVLTPKSDASKYATFIRSSAGIAVFVSDTDDKKHWVEAGRCYERFALQATALNIRTAMLNQPVEVSSMRAHFAASLGLRSGRPDLVVRFGTGPQMVQSLRRPVAAVIV